MGTIKSTIGNKLANFLNKPRGFYKRRSAIDEGELRNILNPGDVLLVEGDTRFSAAIKFMTQSTWSHVCLVIDKPSESSSAEEKCVLLEADIIEGVVTVPLSTYSTYNLRICRPVNITQDDTNKIIEFAIKKIGYQYDLKNIFDLMKYFLPLSLFDRYREGFMKFGEGDPTKAICSSLIAEAFQSVKYPILPRFGIQCEKDPNSMSDEEILCARHHSHFSPRDFDLSPYFRIVKPTIESNFDYKKLKWQSADE
jgi:hypothetical protein